jgi:hypothetical protein
MITKNRKMTPHTLHKVKTLGFFLADRTVYTRLDIMAQNMNCSSRQVRRYLYLLQKKFGLQVVRKPQGFKLIADRMDAIKKLEITIVDFDVFNSQVFSLKILNQG